MCDTFFFGTALRRPSHISSKDGRAGRFKEIAGTARDSLGSSGMIGSGNRFMCMEATLEEEKKVEADRRERMDEAALAGSIALAMAEGVEAFDGPGRAI